MYQLPAKVFLLAFIVPGLLLAAESAAKKSDFNLPISQEMAELTKQQTPTTKETNSLVGHLSLASQAIDLGMKKDALRQLDAAEKTSQALLKAQPETTSDFKYKFGKLTYDVEGVEKNYYVPIVDDVILESGFSEKSAATKNPKIVEKGIQLVHAKVELNLKNTIASIENTKTLVKSQKFTEAGTALAGVLKDSMHSEEIITNPVWSIWGNLTLAEDFFKKQEFKSARFALGAAKSDLATLEKDKVLQKNSAEAGELKTELDQMDKDINEKDPSSMTKLRKRLSTWSHKVKTWL
jgi:hypothetical protein